MDRIAMALSAISDLSSKYLAALSRRGPYTLLPSASASPGDSQTPAFVKFPLGRYACRLSLRSAASLAAAVVFVIMIGTRRTTTTHKVPVEVMVEPDPPHWMNYTLLDGYYLHGVESLVNPSEYVPQYPNGTDEALRYSKPSTGSKPSSRPEFFKYRPDLAPPGTLSGDSNEPMEPCYLDIARTVAIPDLYAYSGIPQSQPIPAMGSHHLFNFRSDICFDRYGRYGAYGLGYSEDEGGIGEGPKEGMGREVADVWRQTGHIDYRNVSWGPLQDQCYKSNQRHFTEHGTETPTPGKKSRQAVVIRLFTGYSWTQHAILNLRALITETALKSGGEYQVHLLLHVKDDAIPFLTDPAAAQRVLDEHVPLEFHAICTLWSITQMRLYYTGNFGPSVENPSGMDLFSVHRSAHLPLQHFAVHHPEYTHFWNWELDIRYLGSYYELFTKLGEWAAKQPRVGAWERSARYYIPGVHGSWENFTNMVNRDLHTSGQKPILGPVEFAREQPIDSVTPDHLPDFCKGDTKDVDRCGVDEPADLITLNPLFDVEGSGWIFSKDITGYDVRNSLPPRRSTLVTAGRLSARLLNIMHGETWKAHHTTFTEMFPPTVALHYGLKAIFTPHPVYLERAWPLEKVDGTFNGGQDHTSGGPGSPFDWDNEHNFRGTTWYYNADFSGRLWRRWLGEKTDGASAGMGKPTAAEEPTRLCLRSMLFHPIKSE